MANSCYNALIWSNYKRKNTAFMALWTDKHIESLVTDAGTRRDGHALAGKLSKWAELGHDANAAWGLVQGSGKDPYRVCVDLTDAATKCTCPSRKFPCKHAAGLLYLLAANAVPTATPKPDWVKTWMDSRQSKKQAAAAKAAEPKPVDEAAQAKRAAKREAKVEAGVAELRLWLEDLIREGLSDPRLKSYAFWDKIAARMVDAQMTPVARRLRMLGGSPFQRQSDWQALMADEIGRVYALTDAYLRLDQLPEPLTHDVRSQLGFSVKQDEIIASQPHIRDRWHVMGQVHEKEDRLMVRRVWLFGEQTRRYALLLDFTAGGVDFQQHYANGICLDADLAFYPSAHPQRAVVAKVHRSERSTFKPHLFPYSTIEMLLNAYADALAANPFIERIPAGVPRAWLNTKIMIDPKGTQLLLAKTLSGAWLNAVTGGDWLPVFGEWDGAEFRTLTLVSHDGWVEA